MRNTGEVGEISPRSSQRMGLIGVDTGPGGGRGRVNWHHYQKACLMGAVVRGIGGPGSRGRGGLGRGGMALT